MIPFQWGKCTHVSIRTAWCFEQCLVHLRASCDHLLRLEESKSIRIAFMGLRLKSFTIGHPVSAALRGGAGIDGSVWIWKIFITRKNVRNSCEANTGANWMAIQMSLWVQEYINRPFDLDLVLSLWNCVSSEGERCFLSFWGPMWNLRVEVFKRCVCPNLRQTHTFSSTKWSLFCTNGTRQEESMILTATHRSVQGSNIFPSINTVVLVLVCWIDICCPQLSQEKNTTWWCFVSRHAWISDLTWIFETSQVCMKDYVPTARLSLDDIVWLRILRGFFIIQNGKFLRLSKVSEAGLPLKTAELSRRLRRVSRYSPQFHPLTSHG